MLADDGMIIVKLFLHISEAEQLERFERRREDPLKSWKLTDDDWRNRGRRDEYKQAIEEMVARTSLEPHAPWHLFPAESKRYARVAVIETVISEIEEGMRRQGMEPPAPIT
jgi:polyphosphate kinase 2 (PPK2 family)